MRVDKQSHPEMCNPESIRSPPLLALDRKQLQPHATAEQQQMQKQDGCKCKAGTEQIKRNGAHFERFLMETSNVILLNSNRDAALVRKADFQGIQEPCLTEAQIKGMKTEATPKGKTYIGGPTDPEQGKAAAGVGALFLKGLAAYGIKIPTDDYRDAETNGRCKIVCFDA